MALKVKFASTMLVLVLGALCTVMGLQPVAAQLGDRWVEQQGELKDDVNARVQRMGDVTFVVPGKWGLEFDPKGVVVTLTISSHCKMLQFRSFGKHETFESIWDQLMPATKARRPDWGTKELTSNSGYPSLWGDSRTQGTDNVVVLYRLEASTRVIPILVVARNDLSYRQCSDIINKFVERVRVDPDLALPPKTRLMLTDLVGEWTSNTVSPRIMYDRRTGLATGGYTAAIGKGYNIFPDGRYTYEDAGTINGQQFRTKEAGRVVFINNQMAFQENGRNDARRYWFISHEIAPNNSTVLTLLGAQYEPTQSATPYYEIFFRTPGK